jgi:cobalamin biosynthesis Mg chelatase CobN
MTRSRARLFALPAAVLALGLMFAGAPAYANYPDTVKGAHRDCGAGNYPLKGHYTIQVLQKALATLSTSAAEYSTCKDALQQAIRAAELAARPKPKPKPTQTHTTTSTTSTTTTTHTTTTRHHRKAKPAKAHPKGPTGNTGPISSQRVSAAVSNGKGPQSVHGVVYTPGAITTRSSSFISSIPDPLLAVLAALIVALGALGGLTARRIVRARRSG